MANHSIVQAWPDCLQHEGGDVILRFSQHQSALFSKRKGWLEPKKAVRCKDGSSKMVYELDLVFDRMMKLAYFSGEIDIINDDKRTWPEDTSEYADPHRYTTPHEPRARFAWNSPQPKLCAKYVEDRSKYVFRMESTYATFQECHETILPPRQWYHGENWTWDGLLRTFPESPTHASTVSYFGVLHKTLFTLAYGQDIKLSKRADTIKTVMFCASLLRLAEHYGMADLIVQRLERYLLTLDNIWKHVSQQSIFFMMLGYRLRSTTLFRDALKHVIGQDLLNQKSIHYADYSAGFVPPEVIELAALGRVTFMSEFDRLCFALRDVRVPKGPPHDWESDSCTCRTCRRTLGGEMLASLLMNDLINRRLRAPDSQQHAIFPSCEPSNGFKDVKMFYEACKSSNLDILCETEADLRWGLHLIPMNKPEIESILQELMKEVVHTFECSVFFRNDLESDHRHDVSEDFSSCEQCKKRSRQARYTNDTHTTYLGKPCNDSCWHHNGGDDDGDDEVEVDEKPKPDPWGCECKWPMPDWTEKDQGVSPEVVKKDPATPEYLEALGIVFPRTEKKRAKSQSLPWWGSRPQNTAQDSDSKSDHNNHKPLTDWDGKPVSFWLYKLALMASPDQH